MSQFDFPRINFEGTAELDVPTANNGYHDPIRLFNQDKSQQYMPPRVYIYKQPDDPAVMTPTYKGYDELMAHIESNPKIEMLADSIGEVYVPITAVDNENYQAWAQTFLGAKENTIDSDWNKFYTLYDVINRANHGHGIAGIAPGYWNLYGDLSFKLNDDCKVHGITVPEGDGTRTYTSEDESKFPDSFMSLAPILESILSFDNDPTWPEPTPTANLCDLDSIGQLTTQIFIGKASLVNKNLDPAEFYIQGNPVKSTNRWMNLFRVINTANIIPTGGSGCFYAKINIDRNESNKLADTIEAYLGKKVDAFFLKFNIHQVQEIRNPNYPALAKKIVARGSTKLPYNPALVKVSGSICPWYEGEMDTLSISRLLQAWDTGSSRLDLTSLPTWNSFGRDMINPIPEGKTEPIGIVTDLNLAPIQFVHDKENKIISLDLFNSIPEYGCDQEEKYPRTSAGGDIKKFNTYENCDLGEISIYFGERGTNTLIGKFNWEEDYKSERTKANGGVVDIPADREDYSGGAFYLELTTKYADGSVIPKTIMTENELWMGTDQVAVYAQQPNVIPVTIAGTENQNLYLSSGHLNEEIQGYYEKAILRVFHRGQADPSKKFTVHRQELNMITGATTDEKVEVYDGLELKFDVTEIGVANYGYVSDKKMTFPAHFDSLFEWITNAQINCVRILANSDRFKEYVDDVNPKEIPWQVIYDEVLSMYRTTLPIMDVVMPIKPEVWSNPDKMERVKMYVEPSNWQNPYYMPITRDLSLSQLKLLTTWADQNINKKKV
ncbi:MAG: hypothetical protein ACI857_000312 [Arenicella sp.]|jgi:hypothetical protein